MSFSCALTMRWKNAAYSGNGQNSALPSKTAEERDHTLRVGVKQLREEGANEQVVGVRERVEADLTSHASDDKAHRPREQQSDGDDTEDRIAAL